MQNGISIEKNKESNSKNHIATLVKTLGNETRMLIFLYLLVNRELSLMDLQKLLGKSKSTVHHHIQKLIKVGFVKDPSVKKAKSYSINIAKVREDLSRAEIDDEDIESEHRVEVMQALFGMLKTATAVLQSTLGIAVDYFGNYLENLESGVKKPDKDEPEMDIIMMAMTEKKYGLYKEMYKDFSKEFRIKAKQCDEEVTKTPYITFHLSIPLGKMLAHKLKQDKRKKS